MGKVIVTGATGFIGKELIKTLYENGESITAIIKMIILNNMLMI